MVEDMAGRIGNLLVPGSQFDHTNDLVARYFGEREGDDFAGVTFNTVGVNDPYSIGADDLLAVHMLSVPVTRAMLRDILENVSTRQQIAVLLHDIDDSVQLWENDAETALAKAEELWSFLDDASDVGWVVAGKLLARKRPHLTPIADDLVWEYLQPTKGRFWRTLSGVLRDAELRGQIETLRPESLQSAEMRDKILTLRLLDVAIWMNVKYPLGS